jgi:archaellum biogenesis ATPase FlaH
VPSTESSAAVPSTNEFFFDRLFQQHILALMMQDMNFLIVAQDIIKPELFSDKILIWFFITIRNHFLDYQMLISESILKNELIKAVQQGKIRKEEDVSNYASCCEKILSARPNKQYVEEELVVFCKTQAIKSAVMSMPKQLINRDFQAINDSMKSALEIGNDLGNAGLYYFIDWPDRVKRRANVSESKIMPTGVTELDVYLGGGLKPRQLGMWMGPSGRGKSVALAHCGKRAVIVGKKVIYYTYELSQDDIAERFDSAFSKIPIASLVDEEYELLNKLEDLGKRWGNSLIIKEFPSGKATLAKIDGHIRQCIRNDFYPDLVLVDYLDLIKPTYRRLQKREELTDLTTELRGMAMELNIPIWSATQAQRAAINMKTHTEAEVSEDIGKINISDIVITINQTTEEALQDIMRLFICKNRNGPKYREVAINCDLKRMAFYIPSGATEMAALATTV